MSGVTPVEDGRREEAAARPAMRAPPFRIVAPFDTASLMWLSTFSTAAIVDERTLRHPVVEARTRPSSRSTARRKPLGELVVDRRLHQEPVGADAGLSGVAILRDDRALDRRIEIGIVEHDERRVAAELERHLLDGAGALRHQQLPTSVDPVNEILRTVGIGRQLAADLARRSGDDIEDAGRQPGALGEHGERQRGERRLRRRLDDHRAAGGERRARPCA